jgi:hypothetical protein
MVLGLALRAFEKHQRSNKQDYLQIVPGKSFPSDNFDGCGQVHRRSQVQLLHHLKQQTY